MKTGSCLCGGVSFEIHGDMRPIIACHCGQCRKQTGSYVAATQTGDDAVVFTSDATLAWYKSSDQAERGFCTRCGSPLFWRPFGRKAMSIYMGAIDGETGLEIEKHIFVADKPDWYDIHDGKPQDQRWNP